MQNDQIEIEAELDQRHPCQVNPMSYLAWHAKAEKLYKQNQRQQFCEICQRWKFHEERCAEFISQRPQPKEQ